MSAGLIQAVLEPRATGSVRLPSVTSTQGAAALYGVVHLLVDATTVSVALRTSNIHALSPTQAFALVLAYDVLAFGSQVLLGFGVDRWWDPKAAMRLGLLFTIASVPSASVHPLLALMLAGAGNALFHLGAGALVLARGLEKASPAGLFVAPGALGLAFGLTYGRLPDLGPLWPLAVASALAFAATWLVSAPDLERRSGVVTEGAPSAPSRTIALALSLLLLSVAVRSLVGLSATRGVAPSAWLLFAVPLVAFAGKISGGYLADRFGWIATSVGALLLSCPLIVFGANHVGLLLTGLLLFQLTMPVTLTATARLMPHSLATAFGWTCLALVVGALPTMFPLTAGMCTRPMLCLWVLVGAAAVGVGLERTLCLRGELASGGSFKEEHHAI